MPKLTSFAAAAMMGIGIFSIAHAEMPGQHPYYLHALSDLRAARWMLQRVPGDAAVNGHEDIAIQRIDDALNELKAAAIDDGKNINEHPPADVAMNRPGRLHKALELLEEARADVNQEEDDPMVRGLKHRSLVHIDEAFKQTKAAIFDAEQ